MCVCVCVPPSLSFSLPWVWMCGVCGVAWGGVGGGWGGGRVFSAVMNRPGGGGRGEEGLQSPEGL